MVEHLWARLHRDCTVQRRRRTCIGARDNRAPGSQRAPRQTRAGDGQLGPTGRRDRGRIAAQAVPPQVWVRTRRMRRPKPRQAAWRMRAHIEASLANWQGACSRRAGGADRRDPQAACRPADSRCERSEWRRSAACLAKRASLARCSRHRVGRVGGGRLDAGFCHCAWCHPTHRTVRCRGLHQYQQRTPAVADKARVGSWRPTRPNTPVASAT